MSAAGVAAPIATIKAYRRKGGAVVTVERRGRSAHRHIVSLRRYHALRWWAIRQRRWKASGAWLRSSLAVSLWATMNGGDTPTQG